MIRCKYIPLLTIVGLIISLPAAYGQYSSTETDRKRVKIRTEYDRTQNTPDHIIFGTLLVIMNHAAASDRVGTVERIQWRMGFEKREAEEFLTRMEAVHTSLRNEYNELMKEMLCKSQNRSKKQIYAAMDTLDDVRLLVTNKHYLVFRQSLDADDAERLTQWLSDKKPGHYHRTAEHESLYENTGEDVIARVQQICAAALY